MGVGKMKAMREYKEYASEVSKPERVCDQPHTPTTDSNAVVSGRAFKTELSAMMRWLKDNYREEQDCEGETTTPGTSTTDVEK